MKKLLFVFIFFLFFPKNDFAAAADTFTFYTYTSRITPVSSDPNFLRNHAIIYPKNATKIDKVYLYFHGTRTGRDVGPTETCYDLKICETAMKAGDVAVFMPLLSPDSGNKTFTSAEFNSYLTEAFDELRAKFSTSPASVSVVAGHSAGVGVIEDFLKYYSVNTTLLFDGCFSNWCRNIVGKNQAGSIYIYYSDYRTDVKTGVEAALSANPNIPTVHLNTTDHFSIPTKCFLDHLINDDCKGGAVGGTSGPIILPTETTDEGGKVRIDTGLLGSYVVDLNKKPLLEINIPGLNFSNVLFSRDDTGTYVYIAWLPQFISAIYKFGIAIVSIVAVVVIIVQGLRVVTSGGGEAQGSAYKKILQSVIGLAIAWGSFAILYNINPSLVQFNALKVKVVEKQDLIALEGEADEDYTEPTASPTTPSTPATPGTAPAQISTDVDAEGLIPIPKSTGLKIRCDNPKLTPKLVQILVAAGARMAQLGFSINVNDCARPVERQIGYTNKCLTDPVHCVACKCRCDDPKGSAVIGCKKWNCSNCPHVNGIGMDVHCAEEKKETDYSHYMRPLAEKCGRKENKAGCMQRAASDPQNMVGEGYYCQDKLAKILREEGACKNWKEDWHFQPMGTSKGLCF